METIASQRAVQLGTVQTYIAEAMAAGYTYPWHRMRVPFSMLASLCGHLRAYHKQQLLSDAALLQELPCDTTQMPDSQQNQTAACPSNGGVEFQGLEVPSHQGLCAGAREVRHDGQDHHHQQQYEIQHEQHQQPLHDRQGGCLHHAGSLSVTQAAAVMMHSADAVGEPGRALHGNADSMQGKAVCGHCSLLKDTESARLQSDGRVCFHDRLGSSAQVGSQRPVQLPDMQLVRELVVTSKGTKAIRDSMDTLVLSYGHMRLALAHIYCLLRHHICSCQQT